MDEAAQTAFDDGALTALLRRDAAPTIEGHGGCAMAQSPDAEVDGVGLPAQLSCARPPARQRPAEEPGPMCGLCGRAGLPGCLNSRMPGIAWQKGFRH